MFDPAFPIEKLRPADYNPRKIDQESVDKLVESLRTLGIIKPVVALQDGLIVAGHQRTRAAKLAGFTATPVAFLGKKPNTADEIRFNQLHNGTDLDSGDEGAWVPESDEPGFKMVKLVRGNFRSAGAGTRTELARMLTTYGNWGGCVATLAGKVLSSGSYALAAAALGWPIRTYYVPAEQEQTVTDIFARTYGQYDYSKIERKTYNQTFAQMFRLREGAKRANVSPTYEWLMKCTPKTARILDFGCGQGDYVRSLKAQGYKIQGMEFYRRKGNAIDLTAVQQMVTALCLSIKLYGLFDVVICDYVLNSVDSQQAEDDVMACVNAFLKPGGTAYFSGRRVEHIEASARATKYAAKTRPTEFLDGEKMSALYRAGEWFFQKFHEKADVAVIVTKHFRDDGEHAQRDTSTGWQCQVTKGKASADPVGAITREFNLPLPGGKTVNRHADVLAAMSRFI